MGVSTDGLRSQRRVPFVTKVYRKINELNIPAKGGVFQGFVYKVINIGQGLWKGWIKAPMGVLVTRSTVVAIRQYVYDSVEVSPDRIFSSSIPTRFFQGISPLDDTGRLVTAIYPSDEDDAAAYRFIITTFTGEKPARPSTSCVGGERVITSVAYRFGDYRNHVRTVHHCYSNGSTLSPTLSHTMNIGISRSSQHLITPFTMPEPDKAFAYTLHKCGGVLYDSGSFKPIIWRYYEAQLNPVTARTLTLHADTLALQYGASSQLGQKMRQPLVNARGIPTYNMGCYIATANRFLIGISVSYLPVRKCTSVPLVCNNNYADPSSDLVPDSDLKYAILMYYFPLADTVLFTLTEVAAPVAALLASELSYYAPTGFDPLTFDPINNASQAELVARTLGRFFGWPVEDAFSQGAGSGKLAPRDTVTFHDAQGEVYSWMRCMDPDAAQGYDYSGSPGGGAIKFDTATVFERVSVVMPPVVLDTVGVRPKILMMTDTKYYCVADNSSNTILGLFVGSPFDEWVEIDLPEGATMHTIRCMQPGDSADSCGFIGIGRQELEDGIVYEFTYIKVAGKDWRRLAPIDKALATPLTSESWDVCTFGDDAITQQMLSVQQVPTAVGARAPELR
jgi:hypothetical protein